MLTIPPRFFSTMCQYRLLTSSQPDDDDIEIPFRSGSHGPPQAAQSISSRTTRTRWRMLVAVSRRASTFIFPPVRTSMLSRESYRTAPAVVKDPTGSLRLGLGRAQAAARRDGPGNGTSQKSNTRCFYSQQWISRGEPLTRRRLSWYASAADREDRHRDTNQ